jgi:hypothetical protein
MVHRLDDEALDRVAQLAAVLHPSDRDRLIQDAVGRLHAEPTAGPGTVGRILRELIGTGAYRRAGCDKPVSDASDDAA